MDRRNAKAPQLYCYRWFPSTEPGYFGKGRQPVMITDAEKRLAPPRPVPLMRSPSVRTWSASSVRPCRARPAPPLGGPDDERPTTERIGHVGGTRKTVPTPGLGMATCPV